MDSANLLTNFLKAARPEWTATQLSAVEEKLEKVGIRDVLELIQSLRGRSEQRLNNRLKAVGEKCFTSDTLTALRRRVREEPALRRAAEQRTANARLAAASGSYAAEQDSGGDSGSGSELLAAPKWNPAAAARARVGSLQGAAPMPTSKDDMISVLEDLGLEVKQCHVRELRAMLFEARRLQQLGHEDLMEEVRSRGLLPSDASSSEMLIRQFLEATFPDSLESHHSTWTREHSPTWTREHSPTWTREHSPRSSADEDGGLTFQILTPSPEPLSLSSLFSNSEEDLLKQCKARGLWSEAVQSKGKGFLELGVTIRSYRARAALRRRAEAS